MSAVFAFDRMRRPGGAAWSLDSPGVAGGRLRNVVFLPADGEDGWLAVGSGVAIEYFRSIVRCRPRVRAAWCGHFAGIALTWRTVTSSRWRSTARGPRGAPAYPT